MLLYDNKFTGFMSTVTTARHRALHDSGHRPCRAAHRRDPALGFRLALSQHAAIAGAGPAAVQARLHHHAGRAGAAAAARSSRRRSRCARCRRGRTGRDAGIFRRRRAGRWSRARASSPARPTSSTGTPSVGNRMTGAGWEEQRARRSRRPRPMLAAGPNSASRRRTISAARTISGSMSAASKKTGAFWITPTALPLDVARGPAGTTFQRPHQGRRLERDRQHLHAWSTTTRSRAMPAASTARATSRSSCRRPASRAGTSSISIPAIYKGKETRPNNYRLPQLTFADDHPGEDLPLFRFAFEVTKDGTVGLGQ